MTPQLWGQLGNLLVPVVVFAALGVYGFWLQWAGPGNDAKAREWHRQYVPFYVQAGVVAWIILGIAFAGVIIYDIWVATNK